MNPEQPNASPIFLPPLQFRDDRVGQRKNSLPAIHAGFPFSAVTSGRKFSLPWLMEEAASTVAPVIGETSLSSGIKISARELSRPNTTSQFEFSVGLHGTLKRDCSLPGQLEDDENVPLTPEKNPANTPVSASSQKTIGSAPSTISDSVEPSEKLLDQNVSTQNSTYARWRNLLSEAQRMGHVHPNSEESYNKGYGNYNMQSDSQLLPRQRSDSFASQTPDVTFRTSVITDQPRFSLDNQMLDEYENNFSYTQTRRMSRSLPQNTYDQQAELPGQLDSQFPSRRFSAADTKDIKVNVAKAGTAVLPLSPANNHSAEQDVDNSSTEGLIPQQPNLTCPHCGEQFPPPPDMKPSSSSSGCSGTISNLCTYVAMAGVVLIGCVAWAQNGHQMPGGDLKNIFPPRQRTQ